MKNTPVIRKSETLEDIVFDGRNKSYGAFDMNQKRRKYLIVAFLISLAGISSVIAVPFINSFKLGSFVRSINDGTSIELTPVKSDPYEVPPPPPPPPVPNQIEKRLIYAPPLIVEKADPNGAELVPIEVYKEGQVNEPVDIEIAPIPAGGQEIEEPKEPEFTNPQEQASFMGGGINDFHKWVAEHITYPSEAVDAKVFGKVIVQFSVNSKGEVVDIMLLRKLHPALDEETIRVIASSPLWGPAKQGGTPVKQRFVIPFSFEMQ